MAAKTIYRIVNPATGTVEFIEKGGKLYAWATLCEFPSNPGTLAHLGFSNAADERGAVKSARAGYKYGTRHSAVRATIVTAEERDAELADIAAAEPEPVAYHFVCTSCGATDEDARCIGGALVHTAGRRMLPADFKRYMQSRRPVDRAEAAKRREALRATREALAEAEAERTETVTMCLTCGTVNLTSQLCLSGDDYHPVTREFTRAEYDQYQAERRGGVWPRSRAAESDTETAAEPAPPTARIRRHNRTTVHAAIVTTGTDAGRDEGDELVTLCGTPGPRGDKLRGWLVLADDTPVTCERCGADPVTEPEEVPVHPALAAGYAATAALTTEKAARFARLGAALTTDNIEPETAERPRMTKHQVTISQVITTTVYVEAPDREAAEALAIEELGELCAQCAGMGPRQSPNVTEVNRYVNDHYDEPVVVELDEYGCLPATPDEEAAAVTAFARVITEQSIKRDGAAEELAALDIMTDIAQRAADRERAYDLAEREYLYLAERYSRTGTAQDGEDLDGALRAYREAAAEAGRCAAIGVDWSCKEPAVPGRAECPAHLGTVAPAKGAPRG